MTMHRLRTLSGGLLMALWGYAQAPLNPLDDIFAPIPPLPPGVSPQTGPPRPTPLAPHPAGGEAPSSTPTPTPDQGAILLRPPRDRRPPPPAPLEFRQGDRVLFVGDRLMAGEAVWGYLETRLTCQFPECDVVFRHLFETGDSPLVQPGTVIDGDGAGADWLEPVLARAAAFKPTVVVVGYGTEASQAGEAGLARFTTAYARLLDGLAALDAGVTLRWVLLSPISAEDLHAAPPPQQQESSAAEPYARALLDLATQRNAEFVNLYGWSLAEGRFARERAEKHGEPLRILADADLDLNPYGYWRMTLVVEQALRWPYNTWRFGLMPDQSLRDGGFGARLLDRSRTDTQARVVLIEDRLPTPNPPGPVERLSGAKPHCYIQLPGLRTGTYALRVDSQPILEGTEAEWARYEIIAQGPSWDQAEALRRAIVEKNDLARRADLAQPAEAASYQARIAELEQTIAQLRRPVQRTYEVVRTGGP